MSQDTKTSEALLQQTSAAATVYLSSYLHSWIQKDSPQSNDDATMHAASPRHLLTATHSRLTYPLLRALERNSIPWRISGHDAIVDGRTGALFSHDSQLPTSSTTHLAVDITAPVARLTFGVIHPVTQETRAGESTEHILSAAGLGTPIGFGMSEPIDTVWNTAVVTELYRDQHHTAPLVIVGENYTGLFTVVRTTEGIHESIDIAIKTPSPFPSDVLDQVAAVALEHVAQEVSIEYVFNLDEQLRRLPGQSPTPIPALVILGPGKLRQRVDETVIDAISPFGQLQGQGLMKSVVLTYPADHSGDGESKLLHPQLHLQNVLAVLKKRA